MSNRSDPLVIKIGGSLFDVVPDIISILLESGRSLLIVPGGGFFAEIVRSLNLDGETAHWMAIAAMDQMGWYIASHGVPPVDRISVPAGPSILLPYREMRRYDPLPHTWDITADTIAAWVAGQAGCNLVLLKSVDGITLDGTLQRDVREPFQSREVDPAFLPYVISHGIRAQVINGRISRRIHAMLAGEPCTGTIIHPSL
jgi:aspartokinase-like uncharacterized kinase